MLIQKSVYPPNVKELDGYSLSKLALWHHYIRNQLKLINLRSLKDNTIVIQEVTDSK